MTDEAVTAGANTMCFASGTLVWTESGLQPIETIRVGDVVLARNEVQGELSLRPVTQIFARVAIDLVNMDLRLSDGSSHAIRATARHPVWVLERGWVPAGEIDPGAEVLTTFGALRVNSVMGLAGVSAPVFNLEVEQDLCRSRRGMGSQHGLWSARQPSLLDIRKRELARVDERAARIRDTSDRRGRKSGRL
jgi:hypothetical protein